MTTQQFEPCDAPSNENELNWVTGICGGEQCDIGWTCNRNALRPLRGGISMRTDTVDVMPPDCPSPASWGTAKAFDWARNIMYVRVPTETGNVYSRREGLAVSSPPQGEQKRDYAPSWAKSLD